MVKKFDAKKFVSNNAIILLIGALAAFVAFNSQNFVSMQNLNNLIVNMSPRFIIACGVSGCLITKGTDLSAGRAACLSAMLLQSVDYAARMLPGLPDIPWPVALLIVMVVMGCFGGIVGAVIAYLKVPPFIATLGMQTIIYGLCSVITDNQPMGGFKSSYSRVALGKIEIGPIDVPYLAFFALAVGLFTWFLYNKTRHGKYMYAIGGNENAAQVAGVNVSATLIRIYIMASMLYALAGFLVGAKAGGASTATGFGYELEAIAACTIGGVSTNGGVGKVSGILVGVLVFELLKICLQFLRVDPAYTFIAQGLVIIVAVALDLRKYLAKK